MRKKVLVLLEVEVDDDIPTETVRKHVAKEAHAARGQFTDGRVIMYDWRSEIHVRLASMTGYTQRLTNKIKREYGIKVVQGGR